MPQTLLPIRYDLDTTGISPNNKVSQEPHQLAPLRVRSISPLYSPFFKEGLVIKDLSDGRILDSTEYKFSNIQALASAMYGKEIYNIILIVNELVSPNVAIDYQVLGGEYSQTSEATKPLIDALYSDSRSVTWNNVTDEPSQFNPSHHLHAVGDVIGFEYVVAALERIRNVLLTASSLSMDKTLSYLDIRLAELKQINDNLQSTINGINSIVNTFNLHIADKQNPHQTDKAQIGLSQLMNYSIANLADINQPDPNTPKYVTNTVLKAYLDNILATYNASLNQQVATLQVSVNTIDNKVAQAKQATDALAASQTLATTLSLDYSGLQNQLNQATSNLTDSQVRAASVIQQYLATGN